MGDSRIGGYERVVLDDDSTLQLNTDSKARVRFTDQVASVVESKVRVSTLTRPEATRRVAWQTGELSFQGETLDAVVAEVNRYNERRLELADPSLGTLQIGGNFTRRIWILSRQRWSGRLGFMLRPTRE